MDDSEFESVEVGGDGWRSALPTPRPIRIVAGYGILAGATTVVIAACIGLNWWGFSHGLYTSGGEQSTLSVAVLVTVVLSLGYLGFMGYLGVTCVRELISVRQGTRTEST